MPIISWSEELSVKVKEVDAQHRILVDLINTLHDTMKKGKGKEIIGVTIDKLADYTQKHFMFEEQLFIKHNYPEAGKHTREHNAFIEKVAHFQKELKAGRVTLSLEVMTFLQEWLINHIKGTDKKYSSFFNAKGVV